MNEGLDRKVALGLALTLALLLATGVYWVTEPSRQKGASDKYKLATAEVFAQNCFFCHGDQGNGGVGPPPRATKLDKEGLVKTISRGVIIMPAWAREEGGTLNPFQVQGLVTFILNWDEELVEEALARHHLLLSARQPREKGTAPGSYYNDPTIYASSFCQGGQIRELMGMFQPPPAPGKRPGASGSAHRPPPSPQASLLPGSTASPPAGSW